MYSTQMNSHFFITLSVLLLFLSFQQLHCNTEKKDSNNKHSKDVDAVKPTFHHKYGKSEIFVYDNLIHNVIGVAIGHYLRLNGFSYMYPDPYEKYYDPSEGDLFWRSPLSPSRLIKSRLWPSIRKMYNSLPEEITKGKRFLPYSVYGTMLQRGDTPIAFRGEPDDQLDGKIFVRLFLSANRDKNMYHDQTFYDENDEIITSVHPKPFRMVVWTGNVQTLFHPPSMGALHEEYSLVIKLTSDENLFTEGFERFKELQERAKEHKSQPFPFKNNVKKFDFDKLNISDHVLGKYYDHHGNVIAFFDNIFPQEFVNVIRSYFVRQEGALVSNPYSEASTELHDNVRFIYQFEPEQVLDTPYIEVVKKLTEYLSNHTGWYPYDVSCNLIRHTHHTRIHVDCVSREHEYTFLMYLNPNWTEDMYAETSFYDEVEVPQQDLEEVMKYGMEEYNFITAAIPKFGRIALFRNFIPHSARPPAPSFLAARYTFPIKVSESYRQARAKMLRENLDHKTEDMANDPLYQPLIMGDYEPYLKDDKREWVETHYKLMNEAKRQSKQDWNEHLTNVLFQAKYRT